MLIDQHWLTVFPAGMDIGVYNPGNGNAPPNGVRWQSTVPGRTALKAFLLAGGGTPGALTQDSLNATSTNAGTFARMIAVLQLNIAFNAANLLGFPNPGFGAMIYNNPGDALDGLAVSQILALANQVLAGNVPPPAGYTFLTLTDLLEDLNGSFSNCVPSMFGAQFLTYPVD
jgi:hypothetical protein